MSHRVYLAIDGIGCPVLEVDHMVLGARRQKSLCFFFTKYRGVPFVHWQEFYMCGFGLGLYGEIRGNALVGAFVL